MTPGTTVLIIFLVIAVILLCSSLRVVRQANAYVIERLGTYTATWGVGLHLMVPVIDKVARKVSLKEQVADFPPQPVITKDNVTMRIDTVLFFQITDPKLYCYGVENPLAAIENLTATTLRNIIGDLELDQTLTSRETINSKMRATLDEATDPWGIKVNRVELKNIMPPAAIQESMEKQMKAERERREQIIRAEGEKQSAITVSEGEKEAKILRATADKEAAILAAEARKQAAILEAQAQREAAIQRAEGNAEAVRLVQQAEADAVKMMNEADPSKGTIAIKGLYAFEKAANGPANKLIIPSELAGVTGLATAVTEAVKTGKEDPAKK
ncbi:MAG: paraslipin [Eubacterium sp.]|nr:paraslipin [Eubacterium sp.]